MFKARALARLTRTFRLELGPLTAEGPPAIIIALAGLVLAVGLSRTLEKHAERLPEVLREAKALADSFARQRGTLPPAS